MDVLLVDFNTMTPTRQLRAAARDVPAHVTAGSTVTAWDPAEDDLAFTATVISREDASLLLHVHPDPVRGPLRPVTATDVVTELRALCPGTLPEDACPQCQSLTSALLDMLAEPDPRHTVTRTAAILTADTHLSSPAFHDGITRDTRWCCYDLELARDAAVLGSAGVPSTLAWGPAHRPANLENHNPPACPSCQNWLAGRAAARALAARAGIDTRGLLDHDQDLLRRVNTVLAEHRPQTPPDQP